MALRRVDTCPYRSNVLAAGEEEASKGKRGEESAVCLHLLETSGARDPELARITRDVCAHCCTQFEPQPNTPNPAVASRLIHLAVKVVALGGVEGCTVDQAQAVKKLAISHLEVVGAETENRPEQRIQRSGLCFYLGEESGTRPCADCQGKVSLKTFACHHEGHPNGTVLRECGKCPDYDERLTRGSVGSWAVAITTAPRKESTLAPSLKSLEEAGWSDFQVYAEPETPLPSSLEHHRVTQRLATMGAWPNFYSALIDLLLRQPQADAYLMCQDDVVYAKGLRDYLETELWPAQTLGVVSLHTAPHQDRGDVEGFYASDLGWDAWGAQAYVFPNAAARAFVRHARVVNHRQRGPRDGLCNVDSVVGQWCRDSGFAYTLHTPSLTQHVGDTSTLWTTASTQGRRRAATFQSEIGSPRK